MQIERMSGESQLDYHKRLVYGKLVDKTCADIDYSELSVPLYGQEHSSDHTRKMMYGSLKTLELLDKTQMENITDASVVSNIDAKIIELQKERQKFYDQRREFNKMVTADARLEHLEAALVEAAFSLGETVGPLFDNESHHLELSDNEAVLVLSDWHYGMTTDNLFNSYDTDECKRRVRKVIDNAIERIKLHRCRTVHIVLLGDFIHGACHVSARVASQELVVDQLMQVSEILAQAINEISSYTDTTMVYSTYGNHARVVPSKKDSIHADNLERIIGWWLKQRLSDNDRVWFADDIDGYLFINACGHDICAIHGDIDSVKSSPRLIGTLMYKELGKNIDCVILGDKHHRESFEELGITSMICGALCGTDDFASDKRLFSTPSQLLLIFNKSGLDAEYRIKC